MKAGRCVCNLDSGRGGETRGGILFNKKTCFVSLLNVNVGGTRASQTSVSGGYGSLDR